MDSLLLIGGRVALVARYLDDFTSCCEESEAEELFPAASVIKVGIMSSLLDAVHNGRMSLSDRLTIAAGQQVGGAGVLFELEPDRDYSLLELCRLMMVVSDNTASNALARHLGLEVMNAFWQTRGYQAVMRRYFMDPVVKGRDNQMSALGAARMLRDLYVGAELSYELRDLAVGILRRQQFREKIPLMLPPDVNVGHKTGELEGVRHDAAVIEAGRPYILVVLTAENTEAPWEVDSAIAHFSRELYQGLA